LRNPVFHLSEYTRQDMMCRHDILSTLNGVVEWLIKNENVQKQYKELLKINSYR